MTIVSHNIHIWVKYGHETKVFFSTKIFIINLLFSLSPFFPFVAFFLTHWGQEKITAIFQMTFWNSFLCIQIVLFRFKFQQNLFLIAQKNIWQHWLTWWLCTKQVISLCNNQGLVYWYVNLLQCIIVTFIQGNTNGIFFPKRISHNEML